MSRRPVGTPAIGAQRVANANPRSGQAELVALANDKCLACPVGDVLHRDVTVAEKDAIVVASGLISNRTIRVDDALRSDIVGRRRLEPGWRVISDETPLPLLRRRDSAFRKRASAARYDTATDAARKRTR